MPLVVGKNDKNGLTEPPAPESTAALVLLEADPPSSTAFVFEEPSSAGSMEDAAKNILCGAFSLEEHVPAPVLAEGTVAAAHPVIAEFAFVIPPGAPAETKDAPPHHDVNNETATPAPGGEVVLGHGVVGDEKNYNDSFVSLTNLTNSIYSEFTALKGTIESILSGGAGGSPAGGFVGDDEPTTKEVVPVTIEKKDNADDQHSSLVASSSAPPADPHLKEASSAAAGEFHDGRDEAQQEEQTYDTTFPSFTTTDDDSDTEVEELKDDASRSSSVCSSKKRRGSSTEFSLTTARNSLMRRSTVVFDVALALTATTVTDPQLLGALSCSAIVVNYISAGYILLPYVFYQAGIVYGSILFAAVALQSYITSVFICETCARAESSNWINSRHGGLPHAYSMAIRDNQYELTSLQHKFLGKKWTKFFLCTMACDLYSITWVLVAVFGKALAVALPIDGIRDNYKMWVGAFMVITVPLSCTNIMDQVLLQFVFLGGRLVMVVLMIGTVVAAFGSSGEHFDVDMDTVEHAPLINLNHTITIIQTAIFATAFQFSVPSIAGISSNKKSMTSIFQRAVSFVYVSNCLLAVLMASYFGSATEPSSNLNWEGYRVGNQGWSKFVSGYVVLFAALDGLAVFPLMCSTLGGILFSGFFGEESNLKDQSLNVQVFFRLLAALPQCLGALYIDDLGVLATFGGIFTLLSYSAAPSMLYLASGKLMQESGLPERTSYSSRFFSHYWVAYGLLVLTALVLIGVLVDAIRS